MSTNPGTSDQPVPNAALVTGAYSSAKAALIMLCRQLAQEWAADGIRVNAVCPGMTRTPLTEPVYQDAATRAAREALVPLGRIGRIGTPADVAQAVCYLADAPYAASPMEPLVGWR